MRRGDKTRVRRAVTRLYLQAVSIDEHELAEDLRALFVHLVQDELAFLVLRAQHTGENAFAVLKGGAA